MFFPRAKVIDTCGVTYLAALHFSYVEIENLHGDTLVFDLLTWSPSAEFFHPHALSLMGRFGSMMATNPSVQMLHINTHIYLTIIAIRNIQGFVGCGLMLKHTNSGHCRYTLLLKHKAFLHDLVHIFHN